MESAHIESDLVNILFTEEEIQAKLAEMAKVIEADYDGKDLLMVGVLRGAVMVMADLARSLDRHVEMDWMAVSSYGSGTKSSGVVRILKDLDADITGRHVLIVEDIIDSGLTLSWIKANLESRSPASVEICALLRKPDAAKVDVDIDGGRHHHHRTLGDIVAILRGSTLAPVLVERAERIFTRLADAEAKVHGTTREAVRFHDVGETKYAIDDRPDPTGREMRNDRALEGTRRRGLLLQWPRAQDRAHDVQALVEQQAEVHVGDEPAEQADDDQAPAHGEREQVALQVRRADEVQDDVDAALGGDAGNLLAKILRLVRNRDVETERARAFELTLRARRAGDQAGL